MSQGIPVGRIIVNSLVDLDVEAVFGLPGTHIYHVFKELEETTSIKTIVGRHETNTVFMADVYGRLKGDPGVSIITAGPGLTNALTGIGQAFSASSPVLVLSGDVPVGGFYEFHGVDLPNILSETSIQLCKDSVTVSEPERVEWYVKMGYYMTKIGRKGPVHIAIPRNVLGSSSNYGRVNVFPEPLSNYSSLEKVLHDYLHGKILIILGPECAYPEYRSLIHDLVIRLNAPFICEVTTIGFLSQTSKFFGGFYEKDFILHPTSMKLLEKVDSLIMLGVRPESVDAKALSNLVSNTTNIIFVLPSLNSRGFIGNFDSDIHVRLSNLDGRKVVGIYGELGVVIKMIIDCNISSEDFGLDLKNGILERYNKIVENLEIFSRESPMNQGNAIHLISEYIPKDSNVLIDVGANEVWARDLIAPIRKIRYLYAGAFGSLGFSFGGSIGSKLADPANETISISGDGSLLMSFMELQTVSFYEMPIKIFVINDGSYGILEHLSEKELSKRLLSDIGGANFAKVAEAMGIEGMTIENNGELESALRDVFKSGDKPILLDILCRKEDVPPFLR